MKTIIIPKTPLSDKSKQSVSSSMKSRINKLNKFMPTRVVAQKASSTGTTIDADRARCREMRRRVREGLTDYVRNENDTELHELMQPLFRNKSLVVWSLDHHIGPMSDLRNIFEPLGVEFIEHTLYHHCEIMCTCDQISNTPMFNRHNILHIQPQLLNDFYNKYKNDKDITRTDAFVVAYSIPLIELFEKLNRSIIVVDALRYEVTLRNNVIHWKSLNELIRKLVLSDAHRGRHVIGANNLYDVEYIQYFTGIKPEYIPSFCAYTGERYNPTRHSYLYARRPNRPVGDFWNKPFEKQYKTINASFKIMELTKAYKKFDFSTIAAHLGIVYLPYQVSLMMFFEQYRMDIPIFVPSAKYLLKLHMEHYLVYDKSLRNYRRYAASLIPPHQTYILNHTFLEHYNVTENVSIELPSDASFSQQLNTSNVIGTESDHIGASTTARVKTKARRITRAVTRTLVRNVSRVFDPNNEVDAESVSYWFSFSDFYTFPHVNYFESPEQLVDILHNMTLTRLRDISGRMHMWNVQELKNLLRYWRTRLSHIADLSIHKPN